MTLRCAPVRILWSIQYTQKPEMSQNSLWILLTVSDWSILLIQCRILKRSVDASILLSEHTECAVVLDTGNCQMLDSGFVIFFWMTIAALVMTTDRYWWGQWGDNVNCLVIFESGGTSIPGNHIDSWYCITSWLWTKFGSFSLLPTTYTSYIPFIWVHQVYHNPTTPTV